MSGALVNALLFPVAVLIYASGLLLWPIRRWLRRSHVRGKTLGVVFLAQLLSYVAVGCCSIIIQLGHFYYWFIFLIELNVLFSVAAVIARVRDARYERELEARHAA
jgi:hypothetical protein